MASPVLVTGLVPVTTIVLPLHPIIEVAGPGKKKPCLERVYMVTQRPAFCESSILETDHNSGKGE
jgi:hypothetical protein